MGEDENLPVVDETATKTEPFDLSAVNNKKSEDDYFNALIVKMDNEKEELMQPVKVEDMFSKCGFVLDKESIRKHLEVWISLYLQKLELVYIQNPILIQINQETVKELETAIATATTNDEEKKAKQSRAAAMQHIRKLKDEIDLDNVGGLLKQMETIIQQIQNYIK